MTRHREAPTERLAPLPDLQLGADAMGRAFGVLKVGGRPELLSAECGLLEFARGGPAFEFVAPEVEAFGEIPL